MPLLLLIAALALWLTIGKGRLPDKRQWPAYLLALTGFILLAKGRLFIGLGIVAAGTVWGRFKGRRIGSPISDPAELTEARELLGLPVGADRAAILAAHRRLIARNHPDAGGSAGLAARLNAARDVLLKSQPE